MGEAIVLAAGANYVGMMPNRGYTDPTINNKVLATELESWNAALVVMTVL